jgi:hypothetical protein
VSFCGWISVFLAAGFHFAPDKLSGGWLAWTPRCCWDLMGIAPVELPLRFDTFDDSINDERTMSYMAVDSSMSSSESAREHRIHSAIVADVDIETSFSWK